MTTPVDELSLKSLCRTCQTLYGMVDLLTGLPETVRKLDHKNDPHYDPSTRVTPTIGKLKRGL